MAEKTTNGFVRSLRGNAYLFGLLSWFVPGSGFFLLGPRYRWRAWLFLAVIHVTFFIGLSFNGGIVPPIWNFRAYGFNIVNCLNYILQIGSGWMALLSQAALSHGWSALAIDEPNAYAELGSFYCLVAGALNYFVVWQGLDRRERKAFEVMSER